MTLPLHILVCEDEDALRDDLAAELAEAGYGVSAACDGEAALAMIDAQRPDLILCDVAMPRMDGMTLMRHLRGHRHDLDDVPFLLLTAFGDRGAELAGKTAGADDYLIKPVDYAILRATIAAHLRQVARLRMAGGGGAVQSGGAVPAPVPASPLSCAFAPLDLWGAGVALVDGAGQVIHANPAMQAACGPGRGLTLGDTLRATGDGGVFRAKLAELAEGAPAIARRAGWQTLRLPRDGDTREMVCFLSRVPGTVDPAVVMVVAVDPERRLISNTRQLMAAFGLTPTEARIATLLAEGLRPGDIAEHTGVSPTTVAFHLKNLFAKTDTRRQAELVGVILSLPILVQ